jgi:hypothetical protein
MKAKLIALLTLAILFLPPPIAGKEPRNWLKGLDLTQRYLVLEDVNVDALNQAGALGYRFAVGSGFCSDSTDFETGESWRNCSYVFVMEKGAEGKAAYRYIRLDGSQEHLNEAASQGFRLVPYYSEGDTQEDGLSGLTEKPPIADSGCRYVVLKGKGAAALLEEMDATAQQGYEVVLFRGQGYRYTVVLQGTAEAAVEAPLNIDHPSRQTTAARYLFLPEKELAPRSGYRLVAEDGGRLLERLPGVSQGCDYERVSANFIDVSKGPERKMNEAAAKGFRYCPRARGAPLVMEKCSGSAAFYEYRILATYRLATIRKELAEAVQQGYEIVGALRFSGGRALILERPRSLAEP